MTANLDGERLATVVMRDCIGNEIGQDLLQACLVRDQLPRLPADRKLFRTESMVFAQVFGKAGRETEKNPKKSQRVKKPLRLKALSKSLRLNVKVGAKLQGTIILTVALVAT